MDSFLKKQLEESKQFLGERFSLIIILVSSSVINPCLLGLPLMLMSLLALIQSMVHLIEWFGFSLHNKFLARFLLYKIWWFYLQITPSKPGSYGLDNGMGVAVHRESTIGGVIAGSSGQGYLSPLKEPTLTRRDGSINVTSSISEMINGRSSSLRDTDGPSVSRNKSKVLLVDGLPTDCTRREVGYLFRPFIGYKDIKLIHKEPRLRGDKAMVFCFVEFVEAKFAITAKDALQGYKFDNKKLNSPALRIDFAHFPLRIPSDRD